jgi:hypothetical protein
LAECRRFHHSDISFVYFLSFIAEFVCKKRVVSKLKINIQIIQLMIILTLISFYMITNTEISGVVLHPSLLCVALNLSVATTC